MNNIEDVALVKGYCNRKNEMFLVDSLQIGSLITKYGSIKKIPCDIEITVIELEKDSLTKGLYNKKGEKNLSCLNELNITEVRYSGIKRLV